MVSEKNIKLEEEAYQESFFILQFDIQKDWTMI